MTGGTKVTWRSDSKERFDVIVVLGAAVGVGGGPSAALRRRVAEGMRRLEAGAAPVLLLSGGTGGARGGSVPAEAEVMRDLDTRQPTPSLEGAPGRG